MKEKKSASLVCTIVVPSFFSMTVFSVGRVPFGSVGSERYRLAGEAGTFRHLLSESGKSKYFSVTTL